MFRARPAKACTYAAERMRMNPAWHTSPTCRFSSSCTRARSKLSRDTKSLGLTHTASTPAARARSRAGACSRSEITTTTRAGKSGAAQASSNACRLLPRPEARTPTARRSELGPRCVGLTRRHAPGFVPASPDDLDTALARDDFADDHRGLPGRGQHLPRTAGVGSAHDDDVAHAEVERAQHLRLAHAACVAQRGEDGGLAPRRATQH